MSNRRKMQSGECAPAKLVWKSAVIGKQWFENFTLVSKSYLRAVTKTLIAFQWIVAISNPIFFKLDLISVSNRSRSDSDSLQIVSGKKWKQKMLNFGQDFSSMVSHVFIAMEIIVCSKGGHVHWTVREWPCIDYFTQAEHFLTNLNGSILKVLVP